MFAATGMGCSGRVTVAIPAISSLSSTPNAKIPRLNFLTLPCPNSFSPNSNFGFNLTLKLPTPKICNTRSKRSKHAFPVPVCCLLGDNYEANPDSALPDSPVGATIDLKLPRRSLLAHFTCNACGARSQKLINRLAYEKGTVFVQCSGCSVYHKLVDNLNLVVEYDFREDIHLNKDADQT